MIVPTITIHIELELFVVLLYLREAAMAVCAKSTIKVARSAQTRGLETCFIMTLRFAVTMVLRKTGATVV
jgi:hypothetical protein